MDLNWEFSLVTEKENKYAPSCLAITEIQIKSSMIFYISHEYKVHQILEYMWVNGIKNGKPYEK